MDMPIRTIATEKTIGSAAVSNDIALVGTQMNNLLQAVYTYDLSTGRLLQTMKAQGNAPNTVALSPDDKLAVASTIGPKAVLWNAQTGALLKSVPGPGSTEDSASRVAFSADGQIITSVYLADLVVFDAGLNQKNKFNIKNPGGAARSIVPSAEGRFLAVGFSRLDNGANLIVYDLVSGQVKLTVSTSNATGVLSVAWAGGNLLTGNSDGSIKLWDGQSGAAITRVFPKHAQAVNAIAVSSDGRLALSGSADTTMKVIEMATGKELHSFNHADDQVVSVAFASNSKAALSCGGNSLKLWDLSGL